MIGTLRPMQTAINQRVDVKERDGYREKCFKDAYSLSCHIRTICVNDHDWNWIRHELDFKDINNNVFSLIEFYKDGSDNSTDYVNLEYLGSAGIIHTERFHRHLDAELKMVELMKEKLHGNNN